MISRPQGATIPSSSDIHIGLHFLGFGGSRFKLVAQAACSKDLSRSR